VPSIGTVYIYLSNLRPREVPFGLEHVDFQVLVPKPGFERAGAFLTEVARKFKDIQQGMKKKNN